MNQKTMTRLRLKIFPIYVLILFACATIPVKTYDETVSQWKSYKDVAGWMNRHFSYDMKRLKETLEKPHLFSVRTPRETFELKSGVCFDAALFAKETLNCIDKSYEAEIVYINNRPDNVNHFVCSFKKDGKLFIMDYGTIYRNMIGTHGPYNSLEEYKEFYLRYHPKVKHVYSITYGFPADHPIQLPPKHRCKP